MKLPLREFSEIVSMLRGHTQYGAGSEGRRASRLVISARIDTHQVENGVISRSFSVLTRDISISGIALLQTVALAVGNELVVALPRQKMSLFVASKVMHCRELASGLLVVGLEFSHAIDEAVMDAMLKSTMDEVARLRRSIIG
ncbi:MAG TPA: PilZ domain-containing protein [Tepidisphaeraceae bacterium]|nr:PilZ domain-containing protein [Tepidisphaeraceae bacterium]